MAVLPEIILLVAALLFFGCSLVRANWKVVQLLAAFMGLATLISTVLAMNQTGLLFDGCYRVDGFSQYFKLVLGAGFFFVIIGGQHLKDITEEVRPEYYLFLFVSCLGLMSLVSSVELVTLFVSLELSSFALYILVPMRSDRQGLRIQMEAGIKYILFGVLATGFMLYGMSYLYGLTGTTSLTGIAATLGHGARPAVIFGLLMVLAGFFYKLAIFPLHFWVPDVYQGAANETTAYVATLPKLGAVALLIRFVTLVPADGQVVVSLMMVLALLSMFYGNLCALVQTDVKRMLGFSGIAHGGFILLGLLTMEVSGYATAMYYVAGYVFMNIACYLVLANVSRTGENVTVRHLNGLYRRQPLLALVLAVGLFALAGIPPMVGFMGEFMLLAGALQKGYLLLVILAAVNAGIAIYYYLRVIKAVYTVEPGDQPRIGVDMLTSGCGVILMLVIILMGAFPSRIIEFASRAVQQIM